MEESPLPQQNADLRALLHWIASWPALLLPFLSRPVALGCATLALLMNVFLLPRTAIGRRIFRRRTLRHDGIVWYPIAVFAMILLLPYPGRAQVAWAILGLGDPLASVIGRRRAHPHLPWNRTKSAAGFIAFLAGGFLGAILYASATGTLADPGARRFLAFAVPLAAIAESLPSRIDDNVRIAGALIVLGTLLV